MKSQGDLRRVLRLGVEKGAAARGRQVNKIRGALLWGLCASVSLSSAKTTFGDVSLSLNRLAITVLASCGRSRLRNSSPNPFMKP